MSNESPNIFGLYWSWNIVLLWQNVQNIKKLVIVKWHFSAIIFLRCDSMQFFINIVRVEDYSMRLIQLLKSNSSSFKFDTITNTFNVYVIIIKSITQMAIFLSMYLRVYLYIKNINVDRWTSSSWKLIKNNIIIF